MTWKIEIAALAITAASVGGYLYQADLFAEQPVTYHAEFTESDYHAFDRDFVMNDAFCEVGLKDDKVCLPNFTPKSEVRVGEALPSDVPSLSASMRMLLVMDSKEAALKTVRFGRTMVLIDAGSGIVQDVMRLDAPNFAASRTPELRGAPISVAAN